MMSLHKDSTGRLTSPPGWSTVNCQALHWARSTLRTTASLQSTCSSGGHGCTQWAQKTAQTVLVQQLTTECDQVRFKKQRMREVSMPAKSMKGFSSVAAISTRSCSYRLISALRFACTVGIECSPFSSSSACTIKQCKVSQELHLFQLPKMSSSPR